MSNLLRCCMHLRHSGCHCRYDALKLVFTDAVFTDCLQATQTILNMLNDPVQKLYLSFLEIKSRRYILRTLLDCFIPGNHLNSTAIENVQFRNPKYFLQLENMYLGAKVNAYWQKAYAKALHDFRIHCLDFFTAAASQIYKRFEFKNTVIKELEVLDPKCVLENKLQSIDNFASKFPTIATSMDVERRLLRNHKFDFDENVSAEEFWFHVKNLAGDGSPMFPHLSSFVEALLCLPHSSANMEKTYSVVNMIKTKQRNRLSTDTLVGLLHTKRMLKDSKCFDFPISSELVNKMTASMYDAD
ncbi:hypothetical protein PR048_009837 [Dryococelus australis]|uniref:HAT C-terminal dimerisation domain-containing protein n=1 Tax=Dryococelus australis TaxID=614101 RepID=A0ABQ9I128_9NEOP|nr:hypothetical protein PR048_009837 [Dryococelus australis]